MADTVDRELACAFRSEVTGLSARADCILLICTGMARAVNAERGAGALRAAAGLGAPIACGRGSGKRHHSRHEGMWF